MFWLLKRVARTVILPLCVLGTCAGSIALATEVKMMTFNIKYNNNLEGSDKATSWNYYRHDNNDRRDRVVSVINTFAPDILGVQEMLYYQLNYLEDHLSDYDYYGVGRDTAETGYGAGERSGFFYRADRFTAIDQGEFWLSDTPDTPGTTFSTHDSIARIATWMVLQDQQTGGNWFVIDTHWSHQSQNADARHKSGASIRDKISELSGGLPVIVMGDFNEDLTGAGCLELINGDPGEVALCDSYDQTGKPNGKTIHDWHGGVSGTPIDHIFYSSDDFQTIDAGIVRTTFDGYYPSDHYAVTATLRVVPEPSCLVLCVIAGLLFLVFAVRRQINSSPTCK